MTVRQKRYSFIDPLLRFWVRLHGHTTPPSESELAREVQAYALARLPYMEPALALADASSGRHTGEGPPDKPWGIIEID